MPFIDTTSCAEVAGEARAMYAHQEAHYGYVPNYAKVFCHRPHVMQLWAQLQSGIRRHMDKRRYELVTLAAAGTLRSTLCSVAHGRALLEFLSEEDVATLARGGSVDALTAAEMAMLEFARAVARDASAITAADVARLKSHGFDDGEIFDIAATAAARSFFSKIVESLGVETDAAFRALRPELMEALAVGRPLSFAERERLPENEAA